MPKPFKLPQSVLVVIYTPAWDVLLIRRTESDPEAPAYWQSVTGSKDTPDEPWSLTAAREVLEETGLDCTRGTVLAPQLRDWGLENVYTIYPRWRHRYAPGVTQNTERVFGLQVPAGSEITLNPREHTDYQWLPYDAAADACFSPSNAEALLQLPHYAKQRLGTAA